MNRCMTVSITWTVTNGQGTGVESIRSSGKTSSECHPPPLPSLPGVLCDDYTLGACTKVNLQKVMGGFWLLAQFLKGPKGLIRSYATLHSFYSTISQTHNPWQAATQFSCHLTCLPTKLELSRK